MGFAADVAEYGREHGITNFMEAWDRFHDPPPDWDPWDPDRRRSSRSRSRERQRERERERQRQEIELERWQREAEKLAAVVRQCIARSKTKMKFLAACEVIAVEDPLAVAESGEEVVETIYDRLDAEARRRGTSSDELVQERLAGREFTGFFGPKSAH
ncbi:unnamed protein product [Durusdinium trenchii]|uniref:Uncharacterized protein n=1 Tax=Durusdinium trenchii TaxID=1381693 RepID=A0ABP0NIK1_9DINO